MIRYAKDISKFAADIGIDYSEAALRKAFLENSKKNIALVRQLPSCFQAYINSFSDVFRVLILSFSELRRLTPDVETLNRLKTSRSKYLLALACVDYIKNRLQAGQFHRAARLELKLKTEQKPAIITESSQCPASIKMGQCRNFFSFVIRRHSNKS